MRAVCNGNPASLEPFQSNYRKAFYGKCLAIIQNDGKEGNITIEASGKGLIKGNLTIQVTKTADKKEDLKWHTNAVKD